MTRTRWVTEPVLEMVMPETRERIWNTLRLALGRIREYAIDDLGYFRNVFEFSSRVPASLDPELTALALSEDVYANQVRISACRDTIADLRAKLTSRTAELRSHNREQLEERQRATIARAVAASTAMLRAENEGLTRENSELRRELAEARSSKRKLREALNRIKEQN